MRPAGATTIHVGQDSTFQQVCLDKDISDLVGFQKYPNLAKLYLQHAHYVAASHITCLEGLQIITWNSHLINTSSDVKEHLTFMQRERKLQLCYTFTYHMPTELKCVFLNTSSLHRHILNVKANFNICVADIILLVETWLTAIDSTMTI